MFWQSTGTRGSDTGIIDDRWRDWQAISGPGVRLWTAAADFAGYRNTRGPIPCR
jgi:hypothetical protein